VLFRSVDRHTDVRVLADALQSLRRREQLLISLRYAADLSFEQVGEVVGMSAVEGRRRVERDAQDGRAGLVNEDGLRAVRDVRQRSEERPRVLELRRDTETARLVNVAVELRAGGGRAGFEHLAGDVVALVHRELDGGQS